jgi:hypothetical protein
MLHPAQFEVNEAWIAFRLNREPISTEQDGDFNCIVLMDAASCFILCSELIPARAEGPTQLEARRLMKLAEQHKDQLPKSLYISSKEGADELAREFESKNIEVISISENQLLTYTREARDGFELYLEDTPH